MKTLSRIFCFTAALVFSVSHLEAKTRAIALQGFKRHMASTYFTYEGVLQNFFDEGPNFFIQVEGQAGLYRFPKSEANTTEVRQFLNEKKRLKKKIKIEVNAQTAEITSISEGN